MNFYKKIKTT